MREAWAAFLSLDARDMCRLGPAFARVGLTWLAVLFRLATLWFMLESDAGFWSERAKRDFYLGLGGNVTEAERNAYDAIRGDAGAARAAWRGGRIDDVEARREARRIASEIARFTSERPARAALFIRHGSYSPVINASYDVLEPYAPCEPFVPLWEGHTAMLEEEDEWSHGTFDCTYIVFAY